MKKYIQSLFLCLLSLSPLKATDELKEMTFEKALVNGFKVEEDKEKIAALTADELVDHFYRMKSNKGDILGLVKLTLSEDESTLMLFGLDTQNTKKPFMYQALLLDQPADTINDFLSKSHTFTDKNLFGIFQDLCSVKDEELNEHVAKSTFKKLFLVSVQDTLDTSQQESNVIDLFHELYAPVISKEMLNVFESDDESDESYNSESNSDSDSEEYGESLFASDDDSSVENI